MMSEKTIAQKAKERWQARFGGGIYFNLDESELEHAAGIALANWQGKGLYAFLCGDPEGDLEYYDDVTDLAAKAYDLYKMLQVADESFEMSDLKIVHEP